MESYRSGGVEADGSGLDSNEDGTEEQPQKSQSFSPHWLEATVFFFAKNSKEIVKLC